MALMLITGDASLLSIKLVWFTVDGTADSRVLLLCGQGGGANVSFLHPIVRVDFLSDVCTFWDGFALAGASGRCPPSPSYCEARSTCAFSYALFCGVCALKAHAVHTYNTHMCVCLMSI